MAAIASKARFLACLALCLAISLAQGAEPERASPQTATISELNAAFRAGELTSESLVRQLLARIDAYDDRGPRVNAVLALNPKALEIARALDEERRHQGPRGPLHGIPVLLKDNIDTADLPTTAGSVMLEGSLPPDDAFVVNRLREAGAIVLGKLNMSEFALGGAFSSLGGQMHNPHDPAYSPAGSSGGSGAAIAAAYAPLALGTDTGGSIRAPAAANGIVGLKPTYGLVSRDGIVPLALSLDTIGPMARSVTDVALALGVLTGVDAADPATAASKGKFTRDYTKSLADDALRGARIGIARDVTGKDRGVDWIVDAAIATMKARGATVVEVRFPAWMLDDLEEIYRTLLASEFRAQLPAYLETLQPRYPKTLEALLESAAGIKGFASDGGPHPYRWASMQKQSQGPALTDYRYTVARDAAVPMVRLAVESLMASEKLDAIAYPMGFGFTDPIVAAPERDPLPFVDCLANLTGLPELVVPAGFNSDGLPVALSFLGRRFDEARLLALGHDFERTTRALRLPRYTPLLGTPQ